MNRRCLLSCVLQALALLLGTQSLYAACVGSSPPYRTDSDADGQPDACDACPMSAGELADASNDPGCYLGLPWIPAAYRAPRNANGTWWRAGECVPAMALPTNDTMSPRGLIVVGAAAADAPAVLALAARGAAWPSGIAAKCLVSINYDEPTASVRVLGLRAPALATLVATWPTTAAQSVIASPRGLGVITDFPIETVHVRGFDRQLDASTLQRLAFGEGTVYAPDLLAKGDSGCSLETVSVADDPYWDPTQSPPPSAPRTICLGAAGPNPNAIPIDWRVVPPSLDAALLAERRQLRYLTSSAAAGTGARMLADAIEGVPLGFRADGPALTARFGSGPFPVECDLQNGAALFWTGPANDTWLLVPEAIGALQQTLHFQPDATSGTQVTTSYTPLDNAEVARHGTGYLFFQRFALNQPALADISPLALRGVESQWPGWPAAAATSETNALYGARWTANSGREDCFSAASDASRVDQQWAYPMSVPATGNLAMNWCPSTLVEWRAANREAASQDGATQACAGAKTITNSLNSVGTFLQIAARCVGKAPPNLIGCSPFACLGAEAEGCQIPSECNGPMVTLSDFGSEEQLDCIATNFMQTLATLPATAHWKDVGNDLDLVPMVASIRTNGLPLSLESFMTTNDLFVGGVHQGLDWNWDIEDEGTIDPFYRSIAERDGKFEGIENELEFLIPMGRWNIGWRDPKSPDLPHYQTHGADSLKSFLTGALTDRGLASLGELWPTTPPFRQLFGLERDPGNQTERSYPVLECPIGGCSSKISANWRSHFGRGMFTPIDAAVLNPLLPTAYMASDPHWPIDDDTGPIADPGALIPIGLEDWGLTPHRLGFLGRPILDCGHDPGRLEIHPPHLLTMDLAHATFEGATGVTIAAFGWANVTIRGRIEFDLWPPPRPSARANLVAAGWDQPLQEQIAGQAGPEDWGWVLDYAAAPSHDDTKPPPELVCNLAPPEIPNHVHCVYTDPSAIAPDATTATWTQNVWQGPYPNPRMTPSFVTSRFDMRVFLGWKDGA